MSTNRRSLLQTKIMLRLELGPVQSVTDLANELSAQRSSTSRSLKTLREKGMVEKDDTGWHLSDSGKQELPRLRNLITDMVEDTSKMTERTDQAVVEISKLQQRALNPHQLAIEPHYLAGMMERSRQYREFASAMLPRLMPPSTYNELAAYVEELSRKMTVPLYSDMAELIRAFDSLKLTMQPMNAFVDATRNIAAMGGEAVLRMQNEFQAALVPLYDTQSRISSMLQDMSSSVQLTHMPNVLTQSNVLIARTIHDLSVSRGVMGLTSETISLEYGDLVKDMGRATSSYAQLMSDRLSDDYVRSLRTLDQLSSVVVPTIPVSYYAKAVNAWVIPESEQWSNFADESGDHEFGEAPIEDLLFEIDPLLVEKRRGAWNAFNRRGADWRRHVGISERELLVHLLEHLVPDEDLPKESKSGNRIKLRTRVYFGRKSSDSEFVEAMVEAIGSLNRQHNKYSHGDEGHTESLRAILHATEWLIYFILKSRT